MEYVFFCINGLVQIPSSKAKVLRMVIASCLSPAPGLWNETEDRKSQQKHLLEKELLCSSEKDGAV